MKNVHDAVSSLLRSAGQRYTGSRRLVVDVLYDEGRPMTLPEILARQPELAQSSAYRNLAELEQAGVVRRIITSDEHSHYELAEDLTGHHHHHLICTDCGMVTDFAVPADLERQIERSATSAARKHGFVVDNHRLDLVGRCTDCRG